MLLFRKRIKRSESAESGLTIIEVMVATFIAMSVFLVLFLVSFSMQNNMKLSEAILDVTETARFAVDHMAKDIHAANHVLYSSDNDTIALEVPSIYADVNGDICAYDPDDHPTYVDTITYDLDSSDPADKKLVRTVSAHEGTLRAKEKIPAVITDHVETLSFYSIDGMGNETALSDVSIKPSVTVIKIKLRTSKKNQVFTPSSEIVTSASLRNQKMGI